jgi:LPS-assembly protein
MSLTRVLSAVLAIALWCSAIAQAQQGRPGRTARQSPETLPIQLDADRIEGSPGKETSAEGNVILRRGELTIRAESLKFRDADESVEASGGVRLEGEGSTVSGPGLRYRMQDATGVFERPEYSFGPRSRPGMPPITARGQAESIEFLGENKYTIKQGVFTTCKPGDDDWIVRADELDLDYTREVGTARGASVVFKGVPIFASPSFDFSLNNQRKSGFLPPSFGTTGKSGPEVSIPYYLNLAPEYDLTLTPRYMGKRGLQIAEQFRYLQPSYSGEFKAEVLPQDKVVDRSRSALSLVHTYNRDGTLTGVLNLNKVSDDNYFKDLATRINITSQATLPREGFLAYNGKWWESGAYTATARVQRFQVLQDPDNPIVPPYARTPQITLSALRQDLGGLDLASSAEFVDFTHPTLVNGRRSTVYPSLSLPLLSPSAFLTPKLGVHHTYYSLGASDAGPPETISRNVPIFSLDSGLIFERDAQAMGQSMTQTLEPRIYYVKIPFRDQSRIPLFDTAIADFNYAQIFSENSFAGGDRINDADQLTVALTSRTLGSANGQEVFRGTIGQRYYFKDQQVTLNYDPVTRNATDPRTYRTSDWLAAVSGRIAEHWTMDAATQYNQRDHRHERFTFATRYQPEPLKTLNLSYRFLRSDITDAAEIKQIDLSSQWPLSARWFGVGRFNYSLHDRRIVESIGGLEYGADCWISRVIVQRFALTAGASTTSLFLQLELNGFSRIGSNPLEALKRNVPGYQRVNTRSPDAKPEGAFDFYN